MLDPAKGVCKALRCFFISRIVSGFLDYSQEKEAELRPAVTREIFFSFIWISVICRILMFHLGNQSITSFDVCRGFFFFFHFWALSRLIWMWRHRGHSTARLHLPAPGRDQQRLALRATPGLQQRRGKPHFLMTTELYLLSFMLLFTRFIWSWTEYLLIL